MKTINKKTELNLYIDLLENGLNEKVIKILNDKFKDIQTEVESIKENPTLGEIFEIYVASIISGFSYEKANENFVVQGNSDGHIDIIFPGKEEIFFVQVKFKKYDHSIIDKMLVEHNVLFNGKKKNDSSECFNGDNISLKKHVFDFQNKHRNKKPVFVFVGLDGRTRDSLKNRFKNHSVQAYSILQFLRRMDSNNFNDIVNEQEFVIEFDHALDTVEDGIPNEDDVFALVYGDKFIEQFTKINDISFDHLFHQNIRNKVVNKTFKNDFLETIKKEPENFRRFNNGITITAKTIINEKANGLIKIHSPQIVNGQQTLRTLVELYKEGVDLSRIKIPIRAMEIDDDALAIRIARYSNNQTAVKKAELNFTGEDYAELVELSKANGFVLKGKKGKTNSEEIMTHILNEGNLSLNELIRSHSSFVYPADYLGKSKNSISSVVKDYFESESKMKSLKKKTNFESAIEAIKEYNNFFFVEKLHFQSKYKHLVQKDKNKKVNEGMKPYKFGISVFYNLNQNNNKDIKKVIMNIYNGPANNEINLFKNNESINKALKDELKN